MFTRCFKREKNFNDYSLDSVTAPRSTLKEYIIPTGFIKKFVKDYKLDPISLNFEMKDVYLSTKKFN